jgi:hypothetical protein
MQGKVELKGITCYIGAQELQIRKLSEFPFYRSYDVLGGKTKIEIKRKGLKQSTLPMILCFLITSTAIIIILYTETHALFTSRVPQSYSLISTES